jgi:diguanylate cyclase (GGDEF)-like protein
MERRLPFRRSRPVEANDSRHLESLRIFHDVARALTSSLELDALLRSIMDKMAEFFDPEHWSLLLVDREKNDLYYALMAQVEAPDAEPLPKDLRIPMGQGVAGHVAATGNPLIVPDVSADPAWAAYAERNPELNLRSLACFPIRHGERTLGVLQLHNSSLDLLPASSTAFLRVLCDYAAIALENARQVRLIHELGITDDCTGLFNARHLYTQLEAEIASTLPTTSGSRVVPIQPPHFSLLFFDLDRFKSVNDTHGHLVGSRLLAEVGSLVKRVIGPQHDAFRYGGDEFVVLLRGLDKPAALALTEQLHARLTSERFLTGEQLGLNVTGSFGLATFPQDGATMHDLIRTADTMMYVAKANGRNQIAVADSSAPLPIPKPQSSRHS